MFLTFVQPLPQFLFILEHAQDSLLLSITFWEWDCFMAVMIHSQNAWAVNIIFRIWESWWWFCIWWNKLHSGDLQTFHDTQHMVAENSTILWNSTTTCLVSDVHCCWMFYFPAIHFCRCELIDPVPNVTHFEWFNVQKLFSLFPLITNQVNSNELLCWCSSTFNLFLFLVDDISNKLVDIFSNFQN